jgi:hypothetical protein
MLNDNTFGKTPAAMYLVRVLNETNSNALIRTCSKQIHKFNRNVHEIVAAVDAGVMSANTAGNLLRILRLEATNLSVSENKLTSQLLSNTIIGEIKRAIRKVTVVRKIEHVLESPYSRANMLLDPNNGDLVFAAMGYVVARENEAGLIESIPSSGFIEDKVTAELLHERSWRRCSRQSKKHTLEESHATI